MNISWFTVIAQIINFLILAWLLKRFLYKPILKAIDDREKLIESELENAKNQEDQANGERILFEEKNKEFDDHRLKMLQDLENEVKAKKEQLFTDLKLQIEQSNKQHKEDFIAQQTAFKKELALKTEEEVFKIVRKTLIDLANTNLEEQILNLFLSKVGGDIDKMKGHSSVEDKSQTLVIKSGFELSAEQKDKLEQALAGMISEGSKPNYSIDPNLIGGIELQLNDYRISWNIAAYVKAMENSINDMIDLESTKDRTEKDVKN